MSLAQAMAMAGTVTEPYYSTTRLVLRWGKMIASCVGWEQSVER